MVRNSVYWLKRGATVLEVRRPKEIRVAITSEGFTLSDTGPGVDPAYEDSIFEIFMSAKPATDRGQGLGLFIVSQLLAADGGSIALAPEKNEDGRRCRFVVNLASVVEGDRTK
jgi:signal transduction histidine kinase